MLDLQQRLLSPKRFLTADRVPRTYQNRYSLIGHRILQEDDRAEPVPDAVFQRLDSIIAQVLDEVTVDTVRTINDAQEILQSIEKIITSANFVCSMPYYLVHSFSEGLLQRPLDSGLKLTSENELRKAHIQEHEDENFSHVDCDLSSLLYLCIAEALQLPIYMVEVPGHNFVRWRISDTLHLNWDTNYGFNRFSDDGYASRYNVTPEHIVKGIYLVELSEMNVEGYFSFIRGIIFQQIKNYTEAIAEYRSSISNYPQSPLSRNNIAWLFVSVPDVQQLVTSDEVLQFAEQSCEIARRYNRLYTLACVYAERDDFTRAIQVGTEAYNMYPSPEYMELIQVFRDGKTWFDAYGTS